LQVLASCVIKQDLEKVFCYFLQYFVILQYDFLARFRKIIRKTLDIGKRISVGEKPKTFSKFWLGQIFLPFWLGQSLVACKFC
jgi:hypothetical protein